MTVLDTNVFIVEIRRSPTRRFSRAALPTALCDSSLR
jgi:hypothetical protein